MENVGRNLCFSLHQSTKSVDSKSRWRRDVALFPACFLLYLFSRFFSQAVSLLLPRGVLFLWVHCLRRALPTNTQKLISSCECVGVFNVKLCVCFYAYCMRLSLRQGIPVHCWTVAKWCVSLLCWRVCFQAASAHYWWSESGTYCFQRGGWLGYKPACVHLWTQHVYNFWIKRWCYVVALYWCTEHPQ